MKKSVYAIVLALMLVACYSKSIRVLKRNDWQLVEAKTTVQDTSKPATVMLQVGKPFYTGPRFCVGTINDCSFDGYIVKHKGLVEFRWYQGHRGYFNYRCDNKYKGFIYSMFPEGNSFEVKEQGDTLILSSEKITYRFISIPVIVSY